MTRLAWERKVGEAPTLVVSARDDGFGTYAAAEYTARHISGARFLGFDQGGHLLVGHDETVRTAILVLLNGELSRDTD